MTVPDVTWTHPALPSILEQIPTGMQSLLDVGCGRGIIGALSRIYREPKRLVGLDVYGPYLEFCQRFSLYDELVQWDLEKLPLPFGAEEFEVATCIEVIEHLHREHGERLLDELERVAQRVVVTTPNLFFEQAEYDGNLHQRHLSFWRPSDFRRRGYKVLGVGVFTIAGRQVRYLSAALGSATRYVPTLSSLLLCVKDSMSGTGRGLLAGAKETRSEETT